MQPDLVMKKLLRALARKFGYEIRKAPFAGFGSAPIFDLAVQHLMLKCGPAVRFVQVGANDGLGDGDPLRRYVLKHEWQGILVEPQPEVFTALQRTYAGLESRLIFENAAISNQGGTISLYRGKDTFRDGAVALNSTVASLDRDVVARQLNMRPEDMEEVRVPTIGLDGLLEKHGWSSFEILQIDTEGHDWQVLQTLSFTNARPLLIQFEHGHLSPQDLGAMTAYLNAHEYLVYFGGHQSDSVGFQRDFLDAK